MRTDLYMGDGQTAGAGQPITGANNIINITALGFVLLDIPLNAACDGTGSSYFEAYSSDGQTDLGQVLLTPAMRNRVFFGFQHSTGLSSVELMQCKSS